MLACPKPSVWLLQKRNRHRDAALLLKQLKLKHDEEQLQSNRGPGTYNHFRGIGDINNGTSKCYLKRGYSFVRLEPGTSRGSLTCDCGRESSATITIAHRGLP